MKCSTPASGRLSALSSCPTALVPARWWLAGVPLALLGVPVQAQTDADSNKLTFSNSFSAEYLSNNEGRKGGGEAVVFTDLPRLRYERNATTLLKSFAELGVAIQHDVVGQQNEHQNVTSIAGVVLPPGNLGSLGGSLTANYTEADEINYDVNRRVSTQTTGLGTAARATFGRFDLSGGGNYSHAINKGFAGQDSMGANSDLRFFALGRTYFSGATSYTYTTGSREPLTGRKLDQSAAIYDVGIGRTFLSDLGNIRVGVSRRELSRSSAERTGAPKDERNETLTAGLSSPLLPPRMFPKVRSNITLSYGAARQVGLDDPGTAQLTGALSLAWDAPSDWTLGVIASRNRNLTVTNLSAENERVEGTATKALLHGTVVKGSAGYERTTIRGLFRNTETLFGTAAVSKTLGTRGRWSTTLEYQYHDIASTAQISDISQHSVMWSLSYSWARVSATTSPGP